MTGSDSPSMPNAPETDAFIERNWFHLDPGWVDLCADDVGEGDERRALKDAEDAAGRLLEEMTRQYNDAVVSAGHYLAIFKEHTARVMDCSRTRPAVDVDGTLLGIFARAYVFGLDGIEGCAKELAGLSRAPETMRVLAKKLACGMGLVRQVRDSLQHIEERVQGKEYGRRIPASIFVLGGFSDRGFTVTTASGAMVTIEVSEAMLESARSRISALDRSLTWRRAGAVCPTCGGSISPHVEGLDRAVESSPPTIEWRCYRCGLRQPVETQR